MDSKTTVNYTGISFSGLLTVVFITLKLLDKIDWSWLWVLSPLWIPFGILLAILLIALVIAGIGMAITGLVGLFTLRK